MFTRHNNVISPNTIANIDETRWVINIRRILDEDSEDDIQFSVSIFNVPKILLSHDPDSYTPQQVSLGPYHYRRPELYDTERYKLEAAKKIRNNSRTRKIEPLIEQMSKLESSIRGCYHKYLDFNGETLSYMMVIDASFLLEFLQIYVDVRETKTFSRVSSKTSRLVDFTRTKSGHNAILKDIIMLENQIPLFVLRKVLEFRFSSIELADNMLLSMLVGLCKNIFCSRMIDTSNIKIDEFAHVLDFLYRMIVPLDIEQSRVEESDNEIGSENDPSNYVKRFSKTISNFFISSTKPITIVTRFHSKIISNFPGFSIVKIALENLYPRQQDTQNNENESNRNVNTINEPPLVEEIAIPSVSDLSKCGVRFLPIKNNNISMISFDIETSSLYLPTITLDVNTSVMLRNLIAYEVTSVSGPLVFVRYIELMNGIIDTENDVRLLREQGIILNRLKSDKDVAKMWNGLSNSVRLTKVGFLDKVIEDVNEYYNGKWSVKLRRFIKYYVYGSWKLVTLIATILILSLLSIQGVYVLYSLNRVVCTSTAQHH